MWRIVLVLWMAIWASEVDAQITLDRFREKQESGGFAEPSPHSTSDSKLSELSPAEINRRLAVVDGEQGTGSGFIALRNGKPTLFTNTHVVAGNRTLEAQTIGGEKLNLTGMEVAEKFDVSVIDQDTIADGFEIVDNLESEVRIGDPVIVLGNSVGSGVATEIHGKVTGIGPELVEVDAKFVQGNSGSPVIHAETGKVIGIATFIVVRELEDVGKDSRFHKRERRFAYRLDTVPGWEPVNWAVFVDQAGKLAAIERRTKMLWNLAEDIAKNRPITSDGARYKTDARIQRYVERFNDDLSRPNLGVQQVEDAKGRLVRGALFEVDHDLKPLQGKRLHSYFEGQLEKQNEQRDFLREFFSEVQESLRSRQR